MAAIDSDSRFLLCEPSCLDGLLTRNRLCSWQRLPGKPIEELSGFRPMGASPNHYFPESNSGRT